MKTLTCAFCQKAFQPLYRNKPKCCSKRCGQKLRQEGLGHGLSEKRECPECGGVFKARKSSPKKFCGRSCLAKDKIKRPEIRQALYNPEVGKKISKALRKFTTSQRGLELAAKTSERMRINNPMSKSEVIDKMISTKANNGTLHQWKGKRGGNGTGMTKPQRKLWEVLGPDWEVELPIKTGNGKRTPGIPNAYKPDLALSSIKLAVEVDGNGHNSKKSTLRDAKKTRTLDRLGWTLLRFTNREVMTDFSRVLLEIRNEVKALSSSSTSK